MSMLNECGGSSGETLYRRVSNGCGNGYSYEPVSDYDSGCGGTSGSRYKKVSSGCGGSHYEKVGGGCGSASVATCGGGGGCGANKAHASVAACGGGGGCGKASVADCGGSSCGKAQPSCKCEKEEKPIKEEAFMYFNY